MKKLVSIVLALALVLAVVVASAATVTVDNPGEGKTYTYYKVFDVTYNTDKSAKATSYTATGADDPFLLAMQNNVDSPFNVEATVITNVYNISKKSSAEDSDIRDWLQGKVSMLTAYTASDFVDGYYLMTVIKGTGSDAVMENATTFNVEGADVHIIDKNQTIPGPDKQEQVANGTWVYEGAYSDSITPPTANVGDTVNYKVIGSFTHYVGTEQVKDLVFTDTMSDGLTANKDVQIIINGNNVTSTATIVYQKKVGDVWTNLSAEERAAATKTIITVPTMDGTTFLYNSENTYEITYSAVINENSIIDGVEENTVDLTYHDENDSEHHTTPDKTKVKDFNITLTKQDTATAAKLAGAQFKLYDAATGGNEIGLVLVPTDNVDAENYGTKTSNVNNVYRPAKTGETAIDSMIVGTTGIIEIKGLDNGDYFFEETVAPDGYNKLTSRTEAVTITNANATITVNNSKGTELPSTGGIGTTIFYILGGLLVVGAAVILVARRKAQD